MYYVLSAAISLGFEHPSYTFSEDEGAVDDVIKLVKEHMVATEQTFSIIVNLMNRTAIEG